MKRLFLLFAALVLLSGCGVTLSGGKFEVVPKKYFATDKADEHLIGNQELSYSFTLNLWTMYQSEYSDLLAWVSCKDQEIREEIQYRDDLVNHRYRRPDTWLGAGAPSYINQAYLEKYGYQEKLDLLRYLARYVNQWIEKKENLLVTGVPCTVETLPRYKRFVANYESGKYQWSQY